MKYIKYLRYLLKHKWYVMVECFKVGLYWQGVVHDWSKFLPSEFFPYVEYFYGDKTNKDCTCIRRKFDKAWNFHQKRNKHHWQYWVVIQDSSEPKMFSVGMPRKYLKEMLCDWRGAGRAISGKDDTKEWYLQHREDIILRPADRLWIERQLNIKL